MSAGGGAGAARLPPELLDALMRLLDREDLLPAAAVCWAWREAGHRRARRALLHHSQDSAVLESWGLVRADHRMRETHCRCLPIYLHHIPLTLTRFIHSQIPSYPAIFVLHYTYYSPSEPS